LQAKILKLIVDRPCGAINRAARLGIPYELITRMQVRTELDSFIPKETSLIVLAGFLSILPQDFCATYTGKIINLHPSLLPKFGGKGMWGIHVHRAVIQAKEKESGATIHYVTAGIDEGRIIAQEKVRVTQDDTPETLQQKVHVIEHALFVNTLVKLQKNL
jgi:phosphoribosylglycinamide formyltransferase-1